MADYLSTNTARIRYTQTGPRGTHKMQFRVKPGTTSAAALAATQPVIEAMMGIMISATAWASAEWANEGSDIFLPIDFVPLLHPDGAEAATNNLPYGLYVNFVGRSLAGSRAAFYLFNTGILTQTANNRLTPAENAVVTTIRDAFAANSAVVCAIDQNSFVLKNYANTGLNDKVAKKSRALV